MSMMTFPYFTKIFIMETNALEVAINIMLSQKGHSLAFFSKKTCTRMQATSLQVREMYDVTEAVKKWCQYLISQHFHIYTNKMSLRNLLLQKIQTPKQHK